MAAHDDLDAPEGGESPKKGRPGKPIEPARVLRAVRRGRWWLLGAATIGVIAGVVVAKLVMKHSYEASASLRFEGVAGLDDESADEMRDSRRDLPSRMESLRRESVLREVRSQMGMDPVPLNTMQRLFDNTQDAESGLVTITARSETPEGAAEFANTIVEVFVAHERGRRREEIEVAIGSLTERMRAAEAELGLSRARYDAFRTEHGVTDLTTEQESALSQAADLRAQADLAVAEIASLEARVRELREEVRRQPRMQVVSSSSESVDQQELARAEAHAQQLRGQLSEDHPRLQVAERQVRALRARVSSGASTKVGSVSMGASTTHETAATALATASADLEGARQRSVQLARLAEEAQQRVESFSAIEGDAAALLADVQVKQTLLNNLQNNRARLTNMLENPDAGFRVIAEATPPESAVPSRRKYYVAAGLPVGLVLLVLIGLLGRELRGLKLHTASEIAYWGNGAVVGTTTWPRDPKASGDLVADLDDYVPEAKGTLLIVGASEHETPLASELAKQLSSDWTDTTLLEMTSGRDTQPEAMRRSLLPAQAGASSMGGVGVLTSAEFDAAPTQVQKGAIELLGPPTLVSSAAPYGVLTSTPVPAGEGERLIATAWEGPQSGQQLRRAARLADRVLVVVPSGAITAPQLTDVQSRLGRKEGVGYVVVGIAEEYATLPDRAGPIDEFWNATKE
jgi:uncharacterized protein involved in exopolysaccharide biosynthesis